MTNTTKQAKPAGDAPEQAPAAEPVKMLPVKLLKNYRPRGAFNVIEMAKPTTVGAKPGDATKLWAGTIVELPRDEVLALIQNQVERMENVIGDDGKVIQGRKRTVQSKFPLAERADALPV